VAICAIGDENPAMASGDSDTTCEPVGRTGTEAVTGTFPAGTPGYYTGTFTAVDAAGNASNTVTIVSLDDVSPPQTGGVVGPAIITGNAAATFNTLATDNIDLNRATPFISYPNVSGVGTLSLEFPSTQLGTYGPDAFTTSAAPQVTIAQFIKSIERLGAISGAQTAGIIVTDQASNAATATSDISAAVRGDTSAAFAARIQAGSAFNSWDMLAPANNTLCNGTTNAGGASPQPCPTNPTATTIQARLQVTPTGTTVPFQRAVFYALNPNTGRAIFLGQGGLSITDVGTGPGSVRTVTYSSSFNASGLQTGNYTVFALGVDQTGSALMTIANITITVAED
jgi:hypothetical protein